MRIGFVSTRLAGTDGVSLETAKWAEVARRLGHEAYYCAGALGPDVPGMRVPEMHFTDPEARRIYDLSFGTTVEHPGLRERIAARADMLAARLAAFISDYQIDLLIPQNVLAIPMHIPLGLAMRDVLRETGLPAIAHQHDFHWERDRFRVTCIPDILDDAFPPDLPNLRHVVISSLAQRELRARRGIASRVVPNVFDFDAPAPGIDDYNRDLRAAIGLTDDDVMILQPTRVVPRKGIELAIELLARLPAPHCVLCITHQAGDEGTDYLRRLQAQAAGAGVDLRYVAHRFDSHRGRRAGQEKVYSLWDAYPHADLVTYPSRYEGFGNALIETVYFRRPALVNRYPVYVSDIAPHGFDFVEIAGRITDQAVAGVQRLLTDASQRHAAVEKNYRLGKQHFSYQVLEAALQELMADG